MKVSFDISTSTDQMGRIFQEVTSVFDDTREVISRRMMDTQEEEVRKALIRLGWTPPPEQSSR